MTTYVVESCPKCGAMVDGESRTMVDRRLKNHMDVRHAPTPAEITIRAAASALADARVRFAREFGRLKLASPGMTDKAAIYAATEATNDEVTRLEAELEIARRTA